MKSCTFFGHRDAPKTISKTVRECIVRLIEKEKVYMFYVGNNGNFDTIVVDVLRELKDLYPIKFAVVLAYLPRKSECILSNVETIYPEGLENVPPRFAINWRNKWMIEQANCVVTCVKYSASNSFACKELAKRKGKMIIDI